MKIAIIYDSKTGNTEKMAEAISKGVKEAGVEVDLKKIGQKFPLSMIGSVDGVMFGSPVIYADLTNEMRGFLEHVKRYIDSGKLSTTGRVAAVFGSYGWDGAWIMEERLVDTLEQLGYEVYDRALVEIDTEIKVNAKTVIERAREYGKNFAESL